MRGMLSWEGHHHPSPVTSFPSIHCSYRLHSLSLQTFIFIFSPFLLVHLGVSQDFTLNVSKTKVTISSLNLVLLSQILYFSK